MSSSIPCLFSSSWISLLTLDFIPAKLEKITQVKINNRMINLSCTCTQRDGFLQGGVYMYVGVGFVFLSTIKWQKNVILQENNNLYFKFTVILHNNDNIGTIFT